MAAVPGVRRRANVALPVRVDRRMLAGVLLVVVSLAGGLLLWRSATDRLYSSLWWWTMCAAQRKFTSWLARWNQ